MHKTQIDATTKYELITFGAFALFVRFTVSNNNFLKFYIPLQSIDSKYYLLLLSFHEIRLALEFGLEGQ